MGRLKSSRETKFSGTYRDRGLNHFPCSADHEQDCGSNLTRLIHTLLNVMTIHIHTHRLSILSKPRIIPGIIYSRKREHCSTEAHSGGGLEVVRPTRDPASSRPKPVHPVNPWKAPLESCPFAAPCWLFF